MIKIEQLCKTYFRAREFNAVDGINLEINDGDFIAIIGKSGSGKSTLLNIISGILSPTSGKIFFDNKEISSLSDDEKSFIRNDSIGFVPQSTVVLSTLNVLDNICLPFFLSKREGDPFGRGKYLLKELFRKFLSKRIIRWRIKETYNCKSFNELSKSNSC